MTHIVPYLRHHCHNLRLEFLIRILNVMVIVLDAFRSRESKYICIHKLQNECIVYQRFLLSLHEEIVAKLAQIILYES